MWGWLVLTLLARPAVTEPRMGAISNGDGPAARKRRERASDITTAVNVLIANRCDETFRA